MDNAQYIPLSDITVTGVFSQAFFPVWVNNWGTVSLNTDHGLGSSGWLLQGESATGSIVAKYDDNAYSLDPDLPYFLAKKSYVDNIYNTAVTNLSQYLPVSGGMLNKSLTLTAAPSQDSHAVTNAYVQTVVSGFLRTKGLNGVQKMTGPVTAWSTLDGDYFPESAVPRSYVENSIAKAVTALNSSLEKYIKLSGDTVTGQLNVATPVNDCDAANFGYLKDYLAQKTLDYFKSTNTIL